MTNADLYFASKEIACRELQGEYLIFSGFTRQTLVVQANAFKLVNLLTTQPRTFDEIVSTLASDDNKLNKDDLSTFVSASLDQFLDFGVLDCNRT